MVEKERASSMPSRSALVIMASGERPVSKRTEVVVLPARTLTSAEKPCSALRPTWVTPDSNCGAFAIPAAGTWGNLGRYVARGPGFYEIDTALQKADR